MVSGSCQQSSSVAACATSTTPDACAAQDLLTPLIYDLIFVILEHMEPRDVIKFAALSRHLRCLALSHRNFYFTCSLTVDLEKCPHYLGDVQYFTHRLKLLTSAKVPLSLSVTTISRVATWPNRETERVWRWRWGTLISALRASLHTAKVVRLEFEATHTIWAKELAPLLLRPAMFLFDIKLTIKSDAGQRVVVGPASKAGLSIVSPRLFSNVAPRLKTVKLQGIALPGQGVPAFRGALVTWTDKDVVSPT